MIYLCIQTQTEKYQRHLLVISHTLFTVSTNMSQFCCLSDFCILQFHQALTHESLLKFIVVVVDMKAVRVLCLQAAMIFLASGSLIFECSYGSFVQFVGIVVVGFTFDKRLLGAAQ